MTNLVLILTCQFSFKVIHNNSEITILLYFIRAVFTVKRKYWNSVRWLWLLTLWKRGGNPHCLFNFIHNINKQTYQLDFFSKLKSSKYSSSWSLLCSFYIFSLCSTALKCSIGTIPSIVMQQICKKILWWFILYALLIFYIALLKQSKQCTVQQIKIKA